MVRRRPSRRSRWWRSAINIRFSSPVSRLSTAENWPVRPIAARTASGSLARSKPAMCTLPASGLRSVDRIWTVMVFPAPLGPSSENVVPSAMSRSIPSRAVGIVQVALHPSEARVEVQPCGDAVTDSDLNFAEGGFCEDGTTRHLAETDVAVGRLRSHCGLCPVDDDLAVGRVDSKVAGNR